MREKNNERSLDRYDVDITENDMYEAMKDIPGYLDITPLDLKEIYQHAYRHAVQRLMNSVKARDIMTGTVISVRPESLLYEVAKTMAEHGISGVPVVAHGELVGIISQKDFLKLIATGAQNLMDVLAECIDGKCCAAGSLREKTARDIMTSPALTLHADETLTQIAELFASRHINRAPVVDQEGRMIGIVSRDDIVKAYSGRRNELL